MVKIKIICVGKIKEKFFNDAIDEYLKRLSRFSKIEIIEIKDVAIPKNGGVQIENEVKQKETMSILSKIKEGETVIILDLNGREYTSEQLAEFLDIQFSQGDKLTFVIGGSLGFSKEIYERANYNVSFSKLTFTHQMIRVLLLEQIYRSFKIINNEKYHK